MTDFNLGPEDPTTNPLTGPLPIDSGPRPKKSRRLRWTIASVATLTIGAAAMVLLSAPGASQPKAAKAPVNDTTPYKAPPTTVPPTTVFVPSPALKQAIALSKCQASLAQWSVWLAATYVLSTQNYTNYDADLEAMPDWDGVYYSQDYSFLTGQATAIEDGYYYGLATQTIETTVGNEIFNQCQSDMSYGYTSWPASAFNDGMEKPIGEVNGQLADNPNAKDYDILYLSIYNAASANDPTWPDR